MNNKLYTVICGFLMGIADSMPGVSGSTIAYIMGIYDTFISSIDSVRNGTKRKKALNILVKIGIGWIFGFLLSVVFISTIIEQNIYTVSSMFIGFTLVAIPLTIKSEIPNFWQGYKNLFYTFLGIIIVIFLMQIGTIFGLDNVNQSIQNPTLGVYLYCFISASVSMGAMLLPGISGSSMLLILGIYYPIIIAIKETLKLNFQYIPVLFIVSIGLFFGLFVFAKIFKELFEKNRKKTFYLIEGLLLGSVWPIILSPTTVSSTNDKLNLSNFSILGFSFGIFLLFILEIYRKNKK